MGTGAAQGQATWFGIETRFTLSSDIRLETISSREQSDLSRAKEFFDNSQWDDVIESYRKLIEIAEGSVLSFDQQRSITLRDYCHWQIAQLPSEALALYQDQVDSVAESWYREGIAKRDTRRLRQVIQEAYCSRMGDKALFALGEIALERGEYSLARRYWQQIHPELMTRDGRPAWLVQQEFGSNQTAEELTAQLGSKNESPVWLFYPNSQIPLADLRARLALTSILSGAHHRAQMEILLLQKFHPEATGRLGGRQGRYVDTLTDLLNSSNHWTSKAAKKSWTTFGRTSNRANHLPTKLDPTGVAWTNPIPLPHAALHNYGTHLPFDLKMHRQGEDSEWPLSFHPLIVNGLVLFNNETHIFAYRLKTGLPAWGDSDGIIFHPQAPQAGKRPKTEKSLARLGIPRFTMTAFQGRLYARMGNPVTSQGTEVKQPRLTSTLVCLDLDRQGSKVWQISPPDESWSFEGSPICDRDSVYIAICRSDITPQSYVACYDARNGALRWQRNICSANIPSQGKIDSVTHNLLTLSDNTLYFNTNLGVVASLSADDGGIRWVARYDREKSGDLANRASHFYRDLNPCLVHQGVVYVAPSDSKQIFALDATTGTRLWSNTQPSDALHLLGVTGNRLVASGRRLWWINTNTGKVIRRWPDATGKSEGYGRGLLAGNEVFWPTKDKIWILDGKTTLPSQEPILLATPDLQATGGNLVAAQGHLLIAGAKHLFCFAEHPQSRRLRPLRFAHDSHDAMAPHYLAEYERLQGNLDAAIALYRKSYASDQSDPALSGMPKDASSRISLQTKLFELLLHRAQQLEKQSQGTKAVALLDEAKEIAPSEEQALRAIVLAAKILESGGNISDALARYHALQSNTTLSGLSVSASENYSVIARLYASRQISRLRGTEAVQSTIQNTARVPLEQSQQVPLPGSHAQTTINIAQTISISSTGHPLSLPVQPTWQIEGKWTVHLPNRYVSTDKLSAILLHNGKRLRAVNPRTGAMLWEHPRTTSILNVEMDEDLLIIAGEGSLEGISLPQGSRLWRQQTQPSTRITNWLLANKRLLISSRDTVRCLAATTGKTLWDYSPPNSVLGSHLLEVDELVVFQELPNQSAPGEPRPGSAWQTVALQSHDGKVVNRRLDQSDWVRAPVASGSGRLVTINQEHAIESYHIRSGELQWRRAYPSSPTTYPDLLYRDNQLVLILDTNHALKVAPEDGAPLWSHSVSLGPQRFSQPRHALTMTDNRFYSISAGVLQAFALHDGSLLWKTRIDESPHAMRSLWKAKRWGPFVTTHPIGANSHNSQHFTLTDTHSGTPVWRSPTDTSDSPSQPPLFYRDGIIMIDPSRVNSFIWN